MRPARSLRSQKCAKGGDDLDDDFEIEDITAEDDGDDVGAAEAGFDAGSGDDNGDAGRSAGDDAMLPADAPGKRKRSSKYEDGMVFDAANAEWVEPSAKQPRTQGAQLSKQQRRKKDRPVETCGMVPADPNVCWSAQEGRALFRSKEVNVVQSTARAARVARWSERGHCE